jgi:hypothetical protein
MSLASFLSASFLVLGSSMSPPAGDPQPVSLAQNENAPVAQDVLTLEPDTPTDVSGVEMVCTGIDSDTRDDPRWKAYPLRLEFAAGDRAYIADEQVTITGAKGAITLAVHCEAPWVLAKLAPGKYSVTATIPRGVSKHAVASVPRTGQARVVLHFPEVPAAESEQPAAAPTP